MKDSTFIIGDRQFQESRVSWFHEKIVNISNSQCANYKILFRFFSVEITEFFCHSDFKWNQLCSLCSGAFECWFSLEISHLKMSKVPKNSKFWSAQMVKLAGFGASNWFHVKSEWQKNPKISTLPKSLCSRNFQNGKLRLDFIKIW